MPTASGDGRPTWQVSIPPGGWPPPWPQLVEIATAIPHTQWTLVGGLMVQLHAAKAGMPLSRPTVDVDMILHIETGAATFSGVREQLGKLGYAIDEPVGDGPVHRFLRGREQIDVMVADHLAPKLHPKALHRPVFAVPGGTSALRKTVNCEVQTVPTPAGRFLALKDPRSITSCLAKTGDPAMGCLVVRQGRRRVRWSDRRGDEGRPRVAIQPVALGR